MAPEFDLLQQAGLDLGARLDNALTHYLRLGYRSAVIMDSDSPTLPARHLVSAFAMLEDGSDAVIGPCDDGGYYLIGLKRPNPKLLRDVRMSTPNVTADTLAVAAEENLRVSLLPTWYDVDVFPSLNRLFDELATTSASIAPHTYQALAHPALRRLFAPSSGESIAPLPGEES
jgi:glycosyltransferase A (GT-A) superfamily protein (DUF2064 family)